MSTRPDMKTPEAIAIVVAWALWVSCFICLFVVDQSNVPRFGFALLALSVLVVTA
jgi:energy-converting hydrogenase Eha subunit G